MSEKKTIRVTMDFGFRAHQLITKVTKQLNLKTEAEAIIYAVKFLDLCNKKKVTPNNLLINPKLMEQLKKFAERMKLDHETIIETIITEFIVNHK